LKAKFDVEATLGNELGDGNLRVSDELIKIRYTLNVGFCVQVLD